MDTPSLTIKEVILRYLDSVKLSRSVNTARTYKNAMEFFLNVLKKHHLPDEAPIDQLSEDAISWMAADLKSFAPSTERLYLTAASGFFSYLSAENLAKPNLPRVQLLIRQRARRPGQRLPQFPQDRIEQILDFANIFAETQSDDESERLRNLRDRAFLIVLADTGLRVHEACGLRRGDVDWNEQRAIIIGKGDREDVIRFSLRATRAIKDYLAARAVLDGASGRPLPSLPIFARHDKGAGKKIKPITTATGRNIVTQRVIDAFGPEAAGTITPHSFRHYFVTTILRVSGNLKLAQELARHRNIAVTQRYAHLSDDTLDQEYWGIFNQTKSDENG